MGNIFVLNNATEKIVFRGAPKVVRQ